MSIPFDTPFAVVEERNLAVPEGRAPGIFVTEFETIEDAKSYLYNRSEKLKYAGKNCMRFNLCVMQKNEKGESVNTDYNDEAFVDYENFKSL